MRRALFGALVLAWVIGLVVMSTDAGASPTECQRDSIHPRWCHRIQVYGHRGEEGPASGTNENTLVALKHDQHWGVAFETDQWNLRDGTPVIMHDVTIRRTVDPASMPPGVTPDSRPGDLSLDQWRHLRSWGGEPLPTVRSWVRHAARWHVPGMVEIKYALKPEWAASIAQLIRASGARVTFYSTPHLYQGRCYQSGAQPLWDVGMTVGVKVNRLCPQTLEQTRDFGYAFVITNSRNLTPAYVRHAHRLGLKVGDYLAGTKAAWTRLVDARVDYLLVPHVGRAVRWGAR